MAAGLYIHVPFCRRKCPYCNFYSIAAEPELLERYTQAVCRNLRHYACAEPVDTVYFGGGTPSLLSPAQIAQILETAADCFTLSPDTEVTMEANPAAAAPIPRNWAYFGLATKTSAAAIPRIIMAVLRLLAPTRPTTGRTGSITLTSVVNFSIFLAWFAITQDKYKMTATFANSDG